MIADNRGKCVQFERLPLLLLAEAYLILQICDICSAVSKDFSSVACSAFVGLVPSWMVINAGQDASVFCDVKFTMCHINRSSTMCY